MGPGAHEQQEGHTAPRAAPPTATATRKHALQKGTARPGRPGRREATASCSTQQCRRRAQPGVPSLTDAPTSVAWTDRVLRLWIPWVRGRGHVRVRRWTLPLMPVAPCLFLFYFYGETFRVSGTRTRLTTEGFLLLCWAGFSLFCTVQTTMACPTEMRPDLMRHGNTLTRCEPTCYGAGGGLVGGDPAALLGGLAGRPCRSTNAELPGSRQDTTLIPCHAVGGFQAWPMLLPCPAELCSSPA